MTRTALWYEESAHLKKWVSPLGCADLGAMLAEFTKRAMGEM